MECCKLLMPHVVESSSPAYKHVELLTQARARVTILLAGIRRGCNKT